MPSAPTAALVAEGDRIQQEREIFRQRAAAVIQGYRTRDAAFRIFRNEKLERYKTLFDLAARYSFMAAKAYDYETGLLNTAAGPRVHQPHRPLPRARRGAATANRNSPAATPAIPASPARWPR